MKRRPLIERRKRTGSRPTTPASSSAPVGGAPPAPIAADLEAWGRAARELALHEVGALLRGTRTVTIHGGFFDWDAPPLDSEVVFFLAGGALIAARGPLIRTYRVKSWGGFERRNDGLTVHTWVTLELVRSTVSAGWPATHPDVVRELSASASPVSIEKAKQEEVRDR